MLDHFRQRAADTLAGPKSATLATSGPGGLQADAFPCQAVGLRLYLLVPRTSEHLVNLEGDPSVVVTAEGWRLRGEARVVPQTENNARLHLHEASGDPWSLLVEVRPRRLEMGRRNGWGYAETFDLEDE
jgi:hypothetical protein